MPNTAPAWWSAVAAVFSVVAGACSAIASFQIMRIQHRNRLDAVRPELLLTSWTRTQQPSGDGAEILAFQTITNVGKGAATNMLFASPDFDTERPTAMLSTIHLPILPAGDSRALDGRVMVCWANVPKSSNGIRYLHLAIKIDCTDSIGIRHQTEYRYFVQPPGDYSPLMGMPEVAPGMALTQRTTKSRSLRRLRLIANAQRVQARLHEGFAGMLKPFTRTTGKLPDAGDPPRSE